MRTALSASVSVLAAVLLASSCLGHKIIRVTEGAYEPGVVQLSPGELVKFMFSANCKSTVTHGTACVPAIPSPLFNFIHSDLMEAAMKFDRPGTYEFFSSFGDECKGGMNGKIVVVGDTREDPVGEDDDTSAEDDSEADDASEADDDSETDADSEADADSGADDDSETADETTTPTSSTSSEERTPGAASASDGATAANDPTETTGAMAPAASRMTDGANVGSSGGTKALDANNATTSATASFNAQHTSDAGGAAKYRMRRWVGIACAGVVAALLAKV